ncbi:MAG: sugar ABC transporter ATP-binding protein [Rectinema sp.]|jgi:simple sugar transport system ATP-binding protein|uniref:ABC transporter domain-containing protein n=1 Tax=uncultured spirochete TaxID=156406 RepID=A0A3P3XQK7_9SPIR|nr:conserved hypothetical protein [uncultured spirochete]
MTNGKPLLSMKGIQKDFLENRVLEDINLDLAQGEILGLVGENGAGKTTLMNILFGMPVIQQTGGYKGTITLDGEEVHFSNPNDALMAGIGMVHQEFFLIPDFSATENIFLNREVTRYSFLVEIFGERLRTLDRAAMNERVVQLIKELGVDINPDTLVSEMPVSYKQFTEIAREIDRAKIKILVVDEPTAVLTETEAEALLTVLRRLAAKGVGIIFISHRLHEILDICDRIVVLRDGKLIRDVPSRQSDVKSIASWMVGHDVGDFVFQPKQGCGEKESFLSIEHLKVLMPGEAVKDVCLQVRKGEILGIGGLAGQGKLGIANGVMGLFHAEGSVTLGGKSLKLNSPLDAFRAGMAFISEDRRGIGLLLTQSIGLNIAFPLMQVKGGLLKKIAGLFTWEDEKKIREITTKYIERLDIKCTGPDQVVMELSGGNQQKVCVAKVLALSPQILFASEPTRGIDIGAKHLVLSVLKEINEQEGTTIIMTSSELGELRSICDRIAIVSEGKVAGVLPAEAPVEDFGLLMLGE